MFLILLDDELPAHLRRVDVAPEEVRSRRARRREGVGRRCRAGHDRALVDARRCRAVNIERELMSHPRVLVVEVDRDLRSRRHGDRALVELQVPVVR